MPIALDKFGELDADQLTQMARVAETAERYEDMCRFMKALVEKQGKQKGLSFEERNLLSVAYKNVVGSRRASWRALNAEVESKQDEMIQKYRIQVEEELVSICNEVLELIKEYLNISVKGNNDEPEVFYLKMAGDYYRYLAEFRPESAHEEGAKKHYGDALELANLNLHETHPTRLGLALNFSVCYYEILKDPKKACNLAKTAFDEAIQKLDSLDDSSYKDSTLIMQLLRDNLTLWTAENQQDEARGEEEAAEETTTGTAGNEETES